MRGDLPQDSAGRGRALSVKENSRPRRRTSRPAAASEFVLDTLAPAIPEMVGGSADLTGSNNTRAEGHDDLFAEGSRGPFHPLRHPRTRHGGGDERHGAARRHHPLFRHVPGVLGLLRGRRSVSPR